jgi:hypothetical protein
MPGARLLRLQAAPGGSLYVPPCCQGQLVSRRITGSGAGQLARELPVVDSEGWWGR